MVAYTMHFQGHSWQYYPPELRICPESRIKRFMSLEDGGLLSLSQKHPKEEKDKNSRKFAPGLKHAAAFETLF